MDTVCTLLILLTPLAVAAMWRGPARPASPMFTRRANATDDPDWYRVSHDADAVRTRFERSPSWPRSGASGERR